MHAVEHPGKATIRLQTVEKLAKGLGVHPVVLLSKRRQIRQDISGIPAIELVAYNLRAIRNSKNLTQVALAENARVARDIIAKIETGARSNPTLELLDRLANGVGANTEDLFRDKS